MSKLTDNDRNFMALVMRSPDMGDGWRKVSNALWPLVEAFGDHELIEKDRENSMVRLSSAGLIVQERL